MRPLFSPPAVQSVCPAHLLHTVIGPWGFPGESMKTSRTSRSFAHLSAKQCVTEANPSSGQTSGDTFKPSAAPKRSMKQAFPWKSRAKTAKHFLEPKARLAHKALNKKPVRLLCHIPGHVPCYSLPKQDGEMSDDSEAHDSHHWCPRRGMRFSEEMSKTLICCTVSKARTGWENEYKLNRLNPSISK